MMDESVRLLTLQQQLEKETDGKISFFGLSVNGTMRECLTNGLSKRADRIKTDFKVSDKRSAHFDVTSVVVAANMFCSSFWHLKLHALTEIRDFEGLDAFSRSKRSPIGYEPFVRHLVEKGHAKEAIAYIARCDSPKRADLYVECGEWRLAGKECKERGDKTKLEWVTFTIFLYRLNMCANMI
jgi:hypothetical protein